MLAWATAKVTVTGAASYAPRALLRTGGPAGMVRVSVVVGMNGAVASNASDLGPAFRQVPLTGGEKVGVPVPGETGTERLTVTTWFEGTWVAPWAGVVEATVKGGAGAVVVAGGLRPAPWHRTSGVATDDEGPDGHRHDDEGDADGDPAPAGAAWGGYEDLVVGHGSKRSGGGAGARWCVSDVTQVGSELVRGGRGSDCRAGRTPMAPEVGPVDVCSTGTP